MIRHIYPDKSEGHQYEKGDRVIVKSTIHNSVFDRGALTADTCTVERVEKSESWQTAMYEIRHDPEWGPASCFKWGLEPHPDTLAAATIQNEQ